MGFPLTTHICKVEIRRFPSDDSNMGKKIHFLRYFQEFLGVSSRKLFLGPIPFQWSRKEVKRSYITPYMALPSTGVL